MAYTTPETVAQYLYDADWRGDALVTMVAIAGAETGGTWDDQARGDQDRAGERTPNGVQHWYDSVGWFQIRSIWELNDTGEDRDFQALITSREHQCRAAWNISKGGTDFTPWSTFTSGAYRQYLGVASRAAEAVAGRGGSAQLVHGFTPTLSPDMLPELPAWDETPVRVPERITGIRIGGRQVDAVAPTVVSARVDLSAEQASQLEIDVVDPRLRGMQADQVLPHGADVYWSDQRMTVAGHRWGSNSGVEQLTVVARDHTTVFLRSQVGRGAGGDWMWSEMSATEVVAEMAGMQGLMFAGKGTLRRAQIVAEGPAGDNPETLWELAERLAREEGHWLFSTGSTLWFAPPSWIAAAAPRFDVRWDRSPHEITSPIEVHPHRAVDVPEVDFTWGDFPDPGVLARSATFLLPRGRGEKVRPGMVARLILPEETLELLVVNVSWEMDGGTSPVLVEALEPIDPIAENPGGLDGEDDQELTPDPQAAALAPDGTTAEVHQFLQVALAQSGDRYVWGAGRTADPDPASFDCSGLVWWAANQVGITNVGATAYYQWVQCRDAGRLVPVADGIRTPGALLFVGSGKGTERQAITHVAISLGDGRTIEAKGRAYGVGTFEAANRFNFAGLLPGLNYGPVATRPVAA